MDKVYKDASSAMAGLIKDGMTIMAGGFGLCGIPEALIEAIRDSGATSPSSPTTRAWTASAWAGCWRPARSAR